MGIIWTILIGLIAGVIAKFIMPGDNEPRGFIHGDLGYRRCGRGNLPWSSARLVSAE
jgi:hypothetical protein